MYNKERKERFLKDLTDVKEYRESYITLFNKTAPYEEWNEKDVCEFNLSEMQEVLKSMATLRAHTLTSRKSALKKYCKWCLDTYGEGKNAEKILAHVEFDIEGNIRDTYFFGPNEIKSYLDDIFGVDTGGSIGLMYKCIVWLMYIGIEFDDIFSLKNDDVDLTNRVINYKGELLPIYQEALFDFEQNLKYDYYLVGCNRYGIPIEKPKAIGDSFIRPMAGTNPNMRSVNTSFNRYAGQSGLQIKNPFKRFQLSGQFYRIYQLNDTWDDELDNFLRMYLPDLADPETKKELSTADMNRLRTYKSYLLRDYKLFRKILQEKGVGKSLKVSQARLQSSL